MDPLPLGRCSHRNLSAKSIQCDRWARLVCSHCNRGVCVEHEKIHQEESQIRIDEFQNQMNDLRQRLHTLTHEQLMENFEKKLDQWTNTCKNEIDRKAKQMLKQGKSLIEQLNMEEFRSNYLHQIEKNLEPNQTHTSILEEQIEQMKEKISYLQITNDGQIKVKHFLTKPSTDTMNFD
ncbi:unnamed protein product [Adineta ricciae]|uniref:Uncharacterized protein n=1 Tax=Adineta ricciae TaxID=249248 RepID=A0A815YEH3_ADIRI|nr:unnamed protein product [Adineta ricciae]